MRKQGIIVFCLFLFFFLSIAAALQFSYERQKDSSAGLKPDLILTKKAIGLIELNGPISFSDNPSFWNPTHPATFIEHLKQFESDKRVEAVLIRINSPGGTVGAAQELFKAINEFKSRTNIPIVASIADMGTSGAYYTAMATDVIFANRGSMVGSIGVILGNVNYGQLAEKYGVSFNVFKSGPYKDILSSWRDSTTEERALLDDVIADVHQQFVGDLILARGLSKKAANAVADGRFFTGKKAHQLGLIDYLGGQDDAIEFLASQANIQGKPLIIQANKSGLYSIFDLLKQEVRLFFSSLFKINFNPLLIQ